MTQSAALGFTRSALVRVSAALAYVILAVGLVYLVQVCLTPERQRAAAAARPHTVPVTEHHAATLNIVATFAVERWTVQRAGRDIPVLAASAQEWQGDLPTEGRSVDLFIHAEPHDPLASGPCAVRATLTTASGLSASRIIWGEGSVAEQVTLSLGDPKALGGTTP